MDRAMRLEVPYDGIRQVAYGPCTIAEYKDIEYLAENHVTGRKRKRHTCSCQGVRCGINGRLGGLRKALFRRKGDEARNYGFAFIGVHRGQGDRNAAYGGGEGAKGVWFIGDYGGDIGTYAFCLTREALDESYQLDHPENMRMALLSVRATVFCTQITARRDDKRRS